MIGGLAIDTTATTGSTVDTGTVVTGTVPTSVTAGPGAGANVVAAFGSVEVDSSTVDTVVVRTVDDIGDVDDVDETGRVAGTSGSGGSEHRRGGRTIGLRSGDRAGVEGGDLVSRMGEHDQCRGDEGDRTGEGRDAAPVADPRHPVPDRVFDESERHGSEHRRHGDTQDRERADPSSPVRSADNTTYTGQCHRYSPYERTPIHTSGPPRQRLRDTTAGQRHQGGDDERGGDGVDEQAAAVERCRAGAVERPTTTHRSRSRARR